MIFIGFFKFYFKLMTGPWGDYVVGFGKELFTRYN